MIPTEIIDRVRDSADIVQIVGEHVELKRTGSDYRGPCPFHGGTNRNFSVVPRKQLYHCFVCHESGDVFTFFMKRFGMDWPTAVREIAGKVGIVIPEDTRDAGPDPNEPLYSALGIAAEWFTRRLREGTDAGGARAYLESRGISDEVRDEFGLGYAPVGRDEFLRAMRGMGLEEDVLVASGLAIQRDDGSVSPRFWGRLLFPIADVRARVVGFGGRILGDGEPKYLNSPETAVFHKGTLLYLLDRARGTIRTSGHAVVVEGYVDAIRLHAAGVTSAVAPLGTALTPEQAKVLRRYTKQVVLAYDADGPGLRSTFRAGDELLRHGASVQVLTMPAGEDPDTLVQKGGAAAFNGLLEQAVDVFERKIQLLDRHGNFTSMDGRREALDKLLTTIRAAADPVTRELYISRAAEKSGVSRHIITQEADKSRTPKLTPAGEPERAPAVTYPEIVQERRVIHLMLIEPALARRASQELAPEDFLHPHYRALASVILSGRTQPPSDLAPLWEDLSQPEGPGFNAEAEFAAFVEWMKNRQLQDEAENLDRLGPVAEPDDKVAGLKRKMKMVAEGNLRPRRKIIAPERESP